MMSAVLSNPNHPEYGVATIPFPIPHDQYTYCMELLKALEIGDAVKADCKVVAVDSFFSVLKRTEMLTVNVEELNYLAKRLDSFDTGEAAQFQAMAHKLELFELKDLINLTFCCQQATVITDFSDLTAIGRDHYMNLHALADIIELRLSIDKERNGNCVKDRNRGSFGRRHNAAVNSAQNDDGEEERGDRFPGGLGRVTRRYRKGLFLRKNDVGILFAFDVNPHAKQNGDHNAGNDRAEEARQHGLICGPGVDQHHAARRDIAAEHTGGSQQRRADGLVITGGFHAREHNGADNGFAGVGASGDRAEYRAGDDHDEAETAFDTADEKIDECDQVFSDSADFNDSAGDDKKRQRHTGH